MTERTKDSEHAAFLARRARMIADCEREIRWSRYPGQRYIGTVKNLADGQDHQFTVGPRMRVPLRGRGRKVHDGWTITGGELLPLAGGMGRVLLTLSEAKHECARQLADWMMGKRPGDAA